jgi:hypothetical protein
MLYPYPTLPIAIPVRRRSRRLVSRRVGPGAAPCAPSASAGLSAYDAKVSRCSQQPPEWVSERQSQTWRASGPARLTATDGARRSW